MASSQPHPSAEQPPNRPKLNPRLLPPLIGLGLLLVIGLIILFSRGGQPKDSDEKVDGRLVRKVEQTPEFTYLELADEKGPFWLATRRVEVEAGDRVYYESAQEARGFPAPSLHRTFERILLVAELFKVDAQGKGIALRPQADAHGGNDDEMGDAHRHGGIGPHASSSTADLTVPRLEKPDGGQTLAEIAAAPAKFSAQVVKVRGMIVRARQRVRPALGQPATNWYRLQDGSGAAEPLLFTTDDELKEGDLVTIVGKLALDRDFGGGLRYKMIVEGASVIRERATSPAAKASQPGTGVQTKEKAP